MSYESSALLAEYLLFHFGADHEILPPPGDPRHEPMRAACGFPLRTVRHFSPGPADRALDLGCAVGRSSFELARDSSAVVGIDFSRSFIHAADALRNGGSIPYDRVDDGNHVTRLTARAPDDIDRSRIRFETGDAMDLPDTLGSFDRVHAANLICRLPHPLRLLDRLPSLVRPGGELVLATPATWLECHTPRENWPDARTEDWLAHHLSDTFELLSRTEEIFLIRETARKYQWSSSCVTVWRRREPPMP